MAQKQFLLTLGLASFLILGFQNCSGVKFDNGSATSAKTEHGFDEADGDVINDDGTAGGDMPAPSTPEVVVIGVEEGGGKEDPTTQPPVILQPPVSGEALAANCKVLRDAYLKSGIQAGSPAKIEVKNHTTVGPRFVKNVGELRSANLSTQYLVGSSSSSQVGEIDLRNSSHVVLCGINALNVKMKNSSKLDLIGANVLGEAEAENRSVIRFFTEDGRGNSI